MRKIINQNEEQLLRNAFSSGMKSVIINQKFHPNLTMLEGANKTEEDFQKFLCENQKTILSLFSH